MGLVLEKLKGAGLKVIPSKCFLCRKEVLYLGHKISREGIATDVNKWLTPTTVQELQKFLGLAGYYRRYVKDFASLAQRLFRLMERGREFKWTQECFAILKPRLTPAPILAFPDFKAVFVLDTDASESGIGVVSGWRGKSCSLRKQSP